VRNLIKFLGLFIFGLMGSFSFVAAAPGLTIQEIEGVGGIDTLSSGLRYQVLKEGTGAKPSITDTVVTHYHGTFLDGSVFDSSVDRGAPATFPVNGVIRGWTEALQLMSVGSKWRLVIPPDLAYGKRGAGRLIPPNATLIFEVELLDIR
jgi:FKBP-type peptidyl-prolyl cis-trans isomerase FklB